MKLFVKEKIFIKFSSIALSTFIVVTIALVGSYLIFNTKASSLSADFNNDSSVGAADLSLMTINWLKTNATHGMGDANGDGLVNAFDLSYLGDQWLQSVSASNYNVMDYGAKHDGVTDDAPAINAAINAANAAGGGTVYMPAGTYMLKTDGPELIKAYNTYHASIIMKSNVILKGAGNPATKLVRAASGYTVAIGADGAFNNFGFEDFYITQYTNGTNGDDGVKIFGATNGHFTNVTIGGENGSQFYTPFMLYGVQNVTLTNCVAIGGRAVAGFVVSNDVDGTPYAQNTNGVYFENSSASNVNTDSGISFGFNIYNESSSLPYIQNVTCNNCTVSNSTGGFYFNYTTHPTITNSNLVNVNGNKYFFRNTQQLWFSNNKDNGLVIPFTNDGNVTTRSSL